MSGLKRKKALIAEQEERFADQVALAVLEKPRVSMWMILLPILLIHFIYRMQKFNTGRKQFSADFMVTRRRALEAAAAAASDRKPPDIDSIVKQAVLPDAVIPSYEKWVEVLVDYYRELLNSKGDSIEKLVLSAYSSRTSFLLALNRLNTVEKQMYNALKPHMIDTTPDAEEIIAAIEHHSRRIRRQIAETIFP